MKVENLPMAEEGYVMVDPAVVESNYRDFVNKHLELREKVILQRPFPFEKFEVDKLRKPSPLKLLLLGESPPSKDYPENYFYNPNYAGKLSDAVFDLFHISGLSKTDQLEAFRKGFGYYLIDTVMCAIKGRIPELLVTFSGENILKDEVMRLKPSCILVLGNNALKGLKCFEPFSICLANIESAVRKKNEGGMEPVISKKCGNVYIVISPFPSRFRNAKIWWQIEEAFLEVSRVVK